MNDRDIRDIAAYWGAPYTAEFLDINKDADKPPLVYKPFADTVEGSLLNLAKHAKGLKISLRPLMSLTDAEVQECMRLVELAEAASGFCFGDDTDFARHDNCISVGADGKMVIDITGEISIDRHYSCNTGAVIAYLQSIGVYVPGTIDPNYVQLL